MNTIIRDEAFFFGDVEKGAMSDARLFSYLAWVSSPCVLQKREGSVDFVT